jgi:hypothetical protein
VNAVSATAPPPIGAGPARTVLAHVSRWTYSVLESSLLSRECVHLSSAAKIGGLVPLALTLRPDLLVLEWGNGGRSALQRLQDHPVTARLSLAVAAPPAMAKNVPAGLHLLPAHDPEAWDHLLGEWLDIPHRSESRTPVSLPVQVRNVAAHEAQPGLILDLSRNGALLRSDVAFPVRTVVALRFTLPPDHTVECLAAVRRHAWDDHGQFHGLRFVEVSAHDAHAIGTFLRAAPLA